VLKICKYFNDRHEIYEKKDGTTTMVEKEYKKKVFNILIPPGGAPIEYDTAPQRHNNRGRRNNGRQNRDGRNGRQNRNNRNNRNKSKSRNLAGWS
jgi:hypothetical protein